MLAAPAEKALGQGSQEAGSQEADATGESVTRIQLDNGEWIEVDDVVEVIGTRPYKEVDRDTELRLTGKELLARGVTTLAGALDEISTLQVRQAGRGGIQVNVRGGRKGAVKVLIDGVPVDEVFYGTFDLSSIPVTDIAQIRVSMAPASPLDGVGGPAGVIEVHTIDAVGPRLIRLRAQGSSLPQADLSATGRAEIDDGIAIRGSLAAGLGRRDFEVLSSDESRLIDINEDRQQVTGSLRMELARVREHVIVDAWAQQRGYIVPPGEDGVEQVVVIDSESSSRFSIQGDLERGQWNFAGRAYAQTLDRQTSRYMDASLNGDRSREKVTGTRAGAGTLVNRAVGRRVQVLAAATIDNETGELTAAGSSTTGNATLAELASGAQAELGPVKLDGSVGVALPLSEAGDSPWPEAKLTATYRPISAVTFQAIVGRKGRLPTLRELYRANIGNPDLEPEIASFFEVETTAQPTKRIKLRNAAYIRDSDGMIRFDAAAERLINVNNLVLRGFDSEGDVEINDHASVGATYSFTDSYSPEFGLESLDFLPRHRIEGRVGARFSRGSARVRVRYQSTQIDQQIKLPTRTTIDFSSYVQLTSSLDASLRLENVLGSKVAVRRGGVRSPGRVVLVSLQTRWQ